jgi:hypothetical protein
MAVRRWFARRKRRRLSGVWPILPGSERLPTGWPGWPQSRRMAFVLTHDVEGPEGLARVRQLAELEMSLGFRSSFNFIPEGDYQVSAELRAWLAENGFEVGVHDFHHDGRLFASRESFRAQARQINRYLKEWNVIGFRAGFMFHNLDWQHDLNVLYDASTFDTDPFEPQPDGVGTIFPFWVPGRGEGAKSEEPGVRSQDSSPTLERRPPAQRSDSEAAKPVATASLPASEASAPRGGYVELPYTLPQDTSLFLLFRERTIDIWRAKLDWIARHSGMALVNVHPDSFQFAGEPAHPRRFAAELYAEFLRYARERHGHEFWHVLPRELAGWVNETRSPGCPFQPPPPIRN